MPLRTASLTSQIKKIGVRLHAAIESSARSRGPDHEPSAAERALADERRRLKEAQAQRRAQALLPKAKPAPVVKAPKPPKAAKPKPPKAEKAPKDAKGAKGAKGAAKPSRADKIAKKAQNLEAAKQAAKKSAKT
jgi:hypothetical protein